MNNEELMNQFLIALNNILAPITINTWFKNIKIKSINNDKILIETEDEFYKNYCNKTYKDLFEEIFSDITKKNYEVEFVYDLPEEITVDKNIEINNEHNINSNLKKELNFDNFMIGESNKLAYNAAKTVARSPGKLYNPFFIYGKSGLGKTHLMHAIGNYIVDNSNLKVLAVTSEQFIDDFVIINKSNGNNYDYIDSFKNKYRNVDVLIIDDIQFLNRAEKTRQEFFHIFEHLRNNNKQIIISSDCSPDDLKFLEDRLKTRFNWGLTVNIEPPDLSLKIKIIKDKIKYYDALIIDDDNIYEYIANNSENDVRHIEGSIKRLYAYSAMMGVFNITLDFTIDALQDYLKKNEYLKSNISKIQKAVAEYYDISVEDLKSKKRTADINYPRHIAIYLCRIITDETTTKIGLEFGGRSHSVVIHSIGVVTEDIKKNPQLSKMLEEIKNKII